MTAAAIIIAFLLGTGAGALGSKVRWRRLPENVVGGMLFPFPKDDRWRAFKCTSSCRGFKLGKVEACEDHGLYVGEFPVDEDDARRYVEQVIKAQTEGLALGAATRE